MKPSLKYGHWILALSVTLLLAGGTLAPRALQADAPSPEQVVQRAWRLAQEANTYRFATEIVQTTYPAPTLVNVGRSTREATLYMEGQADLPNRTLLMTLWQNGGSVLNPSDGIQVRIEGDRAYGRQAGGPWEEVDDFSGAFAPANDLMAYLAGAHDIRKLGTETIQSPPEAQTGQDNASSHLVPLPPSLSYTRYAFEVDGPAFAHHLRDQMERHLREKGELPLGLTLDTSDEMRAVTGAGELWLDSRGLPLRLIVHLVYPSRENGERVEADVKTDFSGFVPLVQAATPAARLASAMGLPRTPHDWLQFGQQGALAVGSLGLFIALIVYSRSKKVYVAFVVTIIISMVIGPLLQSQQVAAFSERMAAQRAEQEQRQQEQESADQVQEEMTASTWDPHRNPLANQQVDESASQQSADPLPIPDVQLPTSNIQSLIAALQLQATTTITNPTADNDGDTLTNIQELRLGTTLGDTDSDGDGITDGAEVRGFQGTLGDMWYLDPLNPDSNNDGLPDTLECPQLLRPSLSALSPSGACQDKDQDGVPDVFDIDNDDDGVPDQVDLSPFSVMGSASAPFNYDNPFRFGASYLQANKPVLVDVQLRPQNPDHLSYALNVMDWPAGDTQGQVQRVLHSTYASHMTGEQLEYEPSAANGDMRLIPMLEIEMTGATIPLPLTTTLATTIQWRSDISGTVKARQSGQNIFLDFSSWPGRSVRYYFIIYNGPCGALGSEWFGPFSVAAGDTSYTIANRDLLDVADGQHAITVYDNVAGENPVCTTIDNIVNGPYTDRMVDAAPLEVYGVSVREKDENGTLLAYVPLNMVNDDTGGARAAFAGRMFYQPGSGGWGNTQKMRLVWLVQMLTDWCDTEGFTPSSDENADEELTAWCSESTHRVERTQVVHTYYEDWRLAGLAVREDHGAAVAIAHEDPTTDQHPDNDDYLWMLAKGLEASFVTGRKGTGGQRDITPSVIRQRFDRVAGSGTDEQRWGIPQDALRVTYYGTNYFPHQGYLANIAAQYSKDALARFLVGGQPTTDAPTLLFAREEYFRSANLDAVPHTNGAAQATVELKPEEYAVETVATVQWAPYRYRNGQWQAYPIAEYMDVLDLRIGDLFKGVPDFYDPNDLENSELALDGAVMAAQSSYLAFYNGVSNIVQRGAIAYAQADFVWTDRQLLDWTYLTARKGLIIGTNAVTVGVVETLINKIVDKLAAKAIEQNVLALFQQAFPTLDFAQKAAEIGKWAQFKEFVGGLSWAGFKSSVSGFVSDKWGMVTAKLKDLFAWARGSPGWALAGAVLALTTIVAVAALAGAGKWDVAISVGVLGLSMFSLGKAIYNLVTYGASEGIQVVTQTVKIFGTVTSTANVAGVIGLIIAAVAAIGFFVYAWASSGVGIFSLAFNAMLAQTIAQIVVAVIMFAIAAIPVVGQLIVAIIAVIDSLIALICTAIGEEARTNVAGQWLCRGLTGVATELIRNVIYDAHDLVDLRNPDRLQFFNFDQQVSESQGVSEGSTVRYSTSVTTTIQLAHVFPDWEEMLEGWRSGTRLIPIDWKSLSYAYQFNNDDLRTAHYTYNLQTVQANTHETLSRYSEDEGALVWQQTQSDFGYMEIVPFLAVNSTSTYDTLDETGINRPVSLYLAEGYNVPLQECFVVPDPPGCIIAPYVPFLCLVPVCHIRDNAATSHIDLGQRMYLDVFPENLSQFYDLAPKDGGYALAWGQTGDVTFPRQRDADGDGLLTVALGGSDPDDSKWDSDGDGLGDYFEYTVGSDPTQPDGDGDGLTDQVEFRLSTDPYRADSDGDGLTDAEEARGWEFVYDLTTGGQLRTRVTSDPLTPDADGDGLTDFQEKTYGFNPRVPESDTVLTLDSRVYETSAPHLLLRFEEDAGAAAFGDSSGYGNVAACDGDGCPTVVEGRYGNALQFDGADDWVEGPEMDIPDDFTLALWVNPDRTSDGQTFIGKHTAGGANLIVFGFSTGGYSFNIRGASYAAGTKTTGWQHLAVVGHRTGASTTEVTVYRNGDLLWQHTLSSVAGDVSGKPWAIGQEWDPGGPSDFFDGAIDEVAVFDRALSETEIEALMRAQYNPSDLFVRPDDLLRYEAAIKNELLGRQAQGLLTTDFPPTTLTGSTVNPVSFMLQPQETAVMSGSVQVNSAVASGTAISLTQVAGAVILDWREQSGFAEMWLPLNEISTTTTFQDYSGNVPQRNGRCSGAHCPAREQPGYFDYGLRLDGINDYVVLSDTMTLGLKDSSFTVSAWVNGAAFSSNDQAIMGTDTQSTNQGLHLVVRNGKPYMGFYGNDLDSGFTLSDGRWYHVVFRYTQSTGEQAIFVNGEPRNWRTGAAAFQGSGTVYLGRALGGNYFNGWMDDVRVFQRALTRDEIRALYGQPVLRFGFEPSVYNVYLDESGFGNFAAGATCPSSQQNGISGGALEFSGMQQCSMFMSESLNLWDSAFTLSIWLYPRTTGSSTYDDYTQGIFGNYWSYRDTAANNTDAAAQSYPTLFRVGRRLRFGFGDGTTWRHWDTGDVLTLNKWNHVVVAFGPIYDQDGNFLENRITFYVDGTPVKSEGVGSAAPRYSWLYNFLISIGQVSSMARLYVDNIWVDDEKDGSGSAELCLAWDEQEIYNQGDIGDDNGDGKSYSVSHEEVFINSGTLRMWEDDRDHSSRGTRCGARPDDDDDPLDGGTRDSGGWSFDIYYPGLGRSGYSFSGDTEGTLYLSKDNPSIPFHGRIDELTLYKRALSAEEVQELYLSVSAALRLRLDDPPGSDTFENSLDLSRQSDAYCSGSRCPTAGVNGRDLQATLFDGNDVLNTNLTVDQSSSSAGVTMMAWVYPTSTSSGVHHVISTYAGGDYLWSLLRNGDKWAFNTGIGVQTTLASVDVGRWQHIAVVYDPAHGTTSFYKDGVREFQSVYGMAYHSTSNTVAIGGRSGGGLYFDGRIDDVRIFKLPLSAADVASIYRAAPILQMHFDDDPANTTQFRDSSGNGLNGTCSRLPGYYDRCPKVGEGIQGQVGLAADFDGVDDYFTVPDDDRLDLDAFSVGLWIMPTANLTRTQILLRKGEYDDINFELHVEGGTLKPIVSFHDCAGWGAYRELASSTPLIVGQWNHVLGTYDGQELVIYVNGYEQGRTRLAATPCHNDATLFVGMGALPPAARIDELTIYDHALGPYEVRDIFLYQGRWVEDRQSHTIVVDDEYPVSALLSYAPTQPYRANQYVGMHVEAHDATSGVSLVELGVKPSGQAAYTWTAAPPCQQTANGIAWCPAFDPTQLGGEGVYTLQTRAIDRVGHRETPAQEYVVYVDGTPPTIASALASGTVVGASPHPSRPGAWRVPLRGTVSDPIIATGVPGSGVRPDSVWVTLLTPAGAPAGEGPQLAALNGVTWTVAYDFGTREPTGVYTLHVEAADRAPTADTLGNRRAVDLGTIVVDAVAPSAGLSVQDVPTTAVTSMLPFSGTVVELPALDHTVLRLHLDEVSGASTFYDASGYGHNATCEASWSVCPAMTDGVYGHALQFDGQDDWIETRQSPFLDLSGGSFSEAFWVYPTLQDDYEHGVLGWESIVADRYNYPSVWVVQRTKIHAGFGDGVNWNTITTDDILTPNAWNHVAVTFDGKSYKVYVNGAERFSTDDYAGRKPYAETRVMIGSAGASRYLRGTLDEVIILSRALLPGEVRTLAQSQVVGVSAVQVAFTPNLYAWPFYNEQTPAGQALHLPFEDAPDENGSLTFYDISGNGHHGQCGARCPATGQSGHDGNAAGFDGSDDFVGISGFGSFTTTTVSAWVYRTGENSTRETIVSYKTHGGCGFTLALNETNLSLPKSNPLRFNNQYPRLYVNVGGTWVSAEQQLPIPQNQWVHLAGTYDGQTIRLYRDGQEVASTPAPGGMTQCTADVAVGSRSSQDMHYFPGSLDEVRIFERALSPAEIRSLYLGAGPVLALPLDQAWITDGSVLPDISGWQHDGTLHAAGTSSNLAVAGQVGPYALNLEGGNYYVAVPDSAAFDLSTFSVGAWVMPYWTSSQPQPLVVKRGASAAQQNYGLYLYYTNLYNGNSGHLRFSFGDCAATREFNSTATLNWRQWNHVMMTYDGAHFKVYINGALDRSVDVAATPCQNAEPVRIGGGVPTGSLLPFAGRVDEVRVYPRALSATEVAALNENRWRAASLSASGAGAEQATWTAQVPAGLEGDYRVDLRGQDTANHTDNSGSSLGVWAPTVDTLAPRVTLTRTLVSGAYHYRMVAEDYNLTDEGLHAPCDVGVIVTSQYFQSPWYLALSAQTQERNQRLYQLAAECEVPAWMMPGLVGSYDTPGLASGIALSGTTAYVADGEAGLQILDISNPAIPRLVATFDTPDTALAVTLPRVGQGQAAPGAEASTPRGAADSIPRYTERSYLAREQDTGVDAALRPSEAPSPYEPREAPLASDIVPIHAAASSARPGSTSPSKVDRSAVQQGGDPDLMVESIVAEPAAVGLNEPFTVTVVVKNQGPDDAGGNFHTGIYADFDPAGQCDCCIHSWACTSVVSLTAGLTATLTFTHTGFSRPGYHRIYAQTDSYCAYLDSNWDNNTSAPITVTVRFFTVTMTSPAGNGLEIARDGVISATFSQVVSGTTFSTRTFTVRGNQTGVYTGVGQAVSWSYIFDAARDFMPGETLVVNLSDGILADDATPLLPYAWQFRSAVDGGTGAFQDSGQSLGSAGSYGIVLGDVDGDGDLDALTRYAADPVRVWQNDGSGVFTDTGQSVASSNVADFALGDLDGDGDLDIFIGEGYAQPKRVWLNDGTGVFTDSLQYLSGVEETLAVALGDLDGDGDLDAFAGNRGLGPYDANQVWLNDGAGVFSLGQNVGAEPTLDVALGDVDGDGDLDALVGNESLSNTVWLNDGLGNFSDSGQALGSGDVAVYVALDDLDGDGDLDAFTAGYMLQSGRVWLNDGSGVFADSLQSLPSPGSLPVELGDLDGDHDLDVTLDGGDIWLNDSTGIFTDSLQSIGLGWPDGALALGDVDGDGDLDVLLGQDSPDGEMFVDAVTLWLNTRLAHDDTFAVAEDSVGNTLNVLANDGFTGGPSLTISSVGAPISGTVTIAGSTVVYTPTLDFTGDDVFTYSVATAGGLLGDTATITVTVGGTNDPPAAQDDTATTNEDTAAAISVLANDSDPDGQTPFLLAVENPTSHGAAAIAGNTVIYTPSQDFNGADTFAYTISDGILTDTARITVTIQPINDAPPFTTGPDWVVAEDCGTQVVPAWATDIAPAPATATDEAGQVLTFTLTNDNNGLFSAQPGLSVAGVLTFTPAANANGVARVSATLQDSGGTANGGMDTTMQSFVITVTAVNDAPQANDVTRATPEDVPLNIAIVPSQVSDVDGDPLTVSSVGAPANGTATTDGSNVVYTPTLDLNGVDVFTYTVRDPGGLTDTATITVTVTEMNDLPTLDPLSKLTIDEDAAMQTVGLSGISSGAPDETQTLTVTATSDDTGLIPHPTVAYTSPNTTGALYFQPVANAFGVVTLAVTVTDGLSQTACTFQVTVTPVNDPPTLDAIPDVEVYADAGPQTVSLSGIGAGPNESQALTVTASSGNVGLLPHPTVVYTSPNPTGSLWLSPQSGHAGAATVVVTVTDGLSQTVRSFQVTVSPFPPRPYAYVADWTGGLRLVDVSTPANPHASGVYTTYSAYDVALSGPYAYVASGYAGLQIIDVSDPADPHKVGEAGFAGNAQGVAVSGGTAYVADGDRNQLRIVDVSDPTDPHQITTYGTPGYAYDVAVLGGYAYVACGFRGLQVVDVSDPANPHLAGSLGASSARGVAVSGNRVYLADGIAGLRVVDVSVPSSPQLVSTFDTPGNAFDVAVAGGLVYVADYDKGLQVINPDGVTPSATACDTAGHCTTVAATAQVQGAGLEPLAVNLGAGALGPMALSESGQEWPSVSIAGVPSVLASADPISVTGEAYVTTTSSLRALTVTVDSALIYVETWPSGTVTQTVWSADWMPAGEGTYVLQARVVDDDGGTASDTLTVTVDTQPPTVGITPTLLTSAQYHPPRAIDITGVATDTGGVASVEATVVQDGVARSAVLLGGSSPTATAWVATWYLGSNPLPDGEVYTITARSVDIVGRSTWVTEPVTVDVTPPTPVTLTLSAAGDRLSPGETLRDTPATLTLTWTQAGDGSGVAGYLADWAIAVTNTTHTTSSIPALATRIVTTTAQDGQKVTAWVVGEDIYQNRRWQRAGPVYVDGPRTPDYAILDDPDGVYRGWMESGCSLLGVDRRASRQAQGAEQRFYATWNAEGLRLAWNGANWDDPSTGSGQAGGDLFVYLDVQAGGAITAYNPYSDTAGAVVYLPGVTPGSSAGAMTADYLVWVRDARTALLMHWDGSAWISDTLLLPAWYRFDAALSNPSTGSGAAGHTDLYLPFDLLGIADPASTPLNLVAFASENDALRLWATAPAANPVNSSRVVETGVFAGEEQEFALTQRYHWDGLGAGVCPNGSEGSTPFQYPDTDLQGRISADPVGTAYAFVDDNLFWLWELLLGSPPADITSLLEPLMSADLPRVGNGQLISYTIRCHNQGAYTATNVVADVQALYALALVGGDRQIPLGDIGPGEEDTVTFYGVVDLGLSAEPWAAVEARIYDDAHDPSGQPLEWLWVHHPVDRDAPEFFGIQQPRYLIGTGTTDLRGYAYDDSGVPTMTLTIQSPSSLTQTLICPDATAQDGQWTCAWDVTASNGGAAPAHGAQFDVQLQATDGLGQSGLGDWQPFVVDAMPPAVTLDVAASGVSDGSVVRDTTFTLVGDLRDDGGVQQVDVCLGGSCGIASLTSLLASAPASYEDAPGAPIAITGGCFERYFDVSEDIAIGWARLGFVAAHTHRDDLQVELRSPHGTTVRVLDDDAVSGTQLQNYDLLLSDAAASAYAAGVGDDPTWPYYERLARPNAPLHAFQGESSAGLWTLRICDTDGAANDGVYYRSLLELTPRDAAVQAARWSYRTPATADRLDHISRTIVISGTDAVGNRSAISLMVWVDNVAPVITVTQAVARAVVGSRDALIGGVAHDGGQVIAVSVIIETPAGEVTNEPASLEGETWQHVLQSDVAGDYWLWINAFDEAGNVTTAGPFGVTLIPPGSRVYLPLVSSAGAPPPIVLPDLAVQASDVLLASTEAQIVVRNVSAATMSADFRVDLYFDPSHVPGISDHWQSIATYGAHWLVPAGSHPLAPGGQVTLTLASAAGSNYPAQIAPFDHAYVQADTLNAVAELNEGNNLVELDIVDIDAPDLIVERTVAAGSNVQVIIRNQGESSVVDEFWVELYVDPSPAPTRVNQIWNDLADQGLVWGVTTPLKPGEALTLTVGDAYYAPQYSQVSWPLPVGTVVYAQVDSVNADTTYGGVLESHEIMGQPYNNIAGPVEVTGSAAGASAAASIGPVSHLGTRLPRRR
ncbi:MAG: tandem-95 repeat protein [Anaerolineae bacterium]|nr:tandem-95 repeat protein [Anaerolineae bacterium]